MMSSPIVALVYVSNDVSTYIHISKLFELCPSNVRYFWLPAPFCWCPLPQCQATIYIMRRFRYEVVVGVPISQ